MAYQASYPDAADETDAGAGAEASTTDSGTKPEGQSDGDGQDAEDGEEDSGEESALIPKGLLAGKEFDPGDEIVLEIVKMRGDEVEVRYAKQKSGDRSQKSEYGKADQKLAMMGQDG